MKRKSVIAILVLFVVAVILAIVFISLFGNKTTKKLATAMNESVESGYLSTDSGEYKNVTNALEKIQSTVGTAYATEITIYLNTYKAYVYVGEFFNDEAYYMDYTKYYKNNRKKVENKLSDAQESMTKMSNYVKEKVTPELTGDKSFWLDTVWSNCKQYMYDSLKDTIDAFNIASNIYQKSISSKLINNDLSTVVFNALKTESSKVLEDMTKLKNGDTSTTVTDINSTKLYDFAESWFKYDSPSSNSGMKAILSYQYNTTENTQTIVANLLEYGEQSESYNKLLGTTLRDYACGGV